MKRAILIATGHSTPMIEMREPRPSVMLPVVDRPFIQHVVEAVAETGITHIDFVLCESPDRIEHFLGDGERWGCTFRYYLAADPAHPYRNLRTIRFDADDSHVLLGHADRLPPLSDLKNAIEHGNSEGIPQVFIACPGDQEANNNHWTGWAYLPTIVFPTIPAECDEKELWEHIQTVLSTGAAPCPIQSNPISAQSYEKILESNGKILSKEFEGPLLGGIEVEPGIWISRNVSLHPSARLHPPVFIGEDCQIGSRVEIGPNTVIGDNCVLDSDITVEHSMILAGGYIGEGLSLDNVIIDRNRLAHLRVGAAVSVTDQFLLGSVAERSIRKLAQSLASRIAGITLLLLCSPLLLTTWLYLKLTVKGKIICKKQYLRLPADTDSTVWRTFGGWHFAANDADWEAGMTPNSCSIRDFMLRFLPSLIYIARGKIRFAGVPCRAPNEVENLPEDWRMIYLRSKAGIVTEAVVNFGEYPGTDECYTAETFYSATSGFKHDAHLIIQYLGKVLRSIFISGEGTKRV